MRDSFKPAHNARQLALENCLQVVDKGKSLSHVLEVRLGELIGDRDKGFCAELCYGVCRYYFVLMESLSEFLKKPLKSRDLDVQMIILLGMYQLRFMRVRQHAAVNETVKLLQGRKKPWAKGVVNGVLRNYQRQLDAVEDNETVGFSALEHSRAYPPWMRELITQDWVEQADRVLAAGNQQAPMVLRVDLNRLSRSDYIQQLSADGIQARPHACVDSAVILESPVAVDRLAGFDDGLVSVQDAAAQLAAVLLDCEPGMRVLDACAAPGGKTLHILQACSGLSVTAMDKDEQRIQRVEENLQRGGLSARLVCADAADINAWHDGGSFDRILLDAPCSASGIIRRHPDIRLLRQPADIDNLVRQQSRLLEAMWLLLKPGGRLLYSTCSIFRQENELQVAHFVSAHDDCVEVPLNSVQWGLQRQSGRQILPGFDDMDGFYYASLEKQA